MSRPVNFKFRLYVAGETFNSSQAKTNLAALCRIHLQGRYAIEVVNVFQEPGRALADGVFMTPCLLKLAPLPVCTIVGTLSQMETVLQALGLEPNLT